MHTGRLLPRFTGDERNFCHSALRLDAGITRKRCMIDRFVLISSV